MSALHTSCVAAALAALLSAAYLAYTLAEQTWLAPLVGAPRRVLFPVAALLALGAAALDPRPLSIALAAFTGAALAYAIRRQWLFPWASAPLGPIPPGPLDAPVLVLPGGDAVPLADVLRHRVLDHGAFAVVHCSIAHSLAVLEKPADRRLAAVLPHPTGFFIGDGARTWDGVDGAARDGGPPLPRHPVRLMSIADWRATHPAAALLGTHPSAARAPLPPTVRARTRSARVAADHNDSTWGAVDDDGWRAVSGPLDPSLATPSESASPRHLLARWAARRRGIRGA